MGILDLYTSRSAAALVPYIYYTYVLCSFLSQTRKNAPHDLLALRSLNPKHENVISKFLESRFSIYLFCANII